MELLLTLEHRFARTPDGAVWSPTSYAYPFWARYLAVFEMVRVLARCQEVSDGEPGWVQVNGPQVSVEAVPHYLGPMQYLRRRNAVRRAVRQQVEPGRAYLLRVPGLVSELARLRLSRWACPFGVEVVGDPHDVFAPGSVRHPFRPLFRHLFAARLRDQCRTADCSLYVTQHALQRRYPPSSRSIHLATGGVEPVTTAPLTVGISDVELPEAAFIKAPRESLGIQGRFRVICVGMLEQL